MNVWFILAGISFAVAIYFLIKDIRMRKRRSPLQKQSIEELLREAKKIAESLKNNNPHTPSDVILVHILREIGNIPAQINATVYFASAVLFTGQFFIIGLLWSLK